MVRIRFEVPGTPIPLERARMGNGHMFTPKRSVQYQEKVRRCAVFAGCPVFAKGCRVELHFYFPDKRVRDIDNCLKGVADALQASTRLNRRAIAWVNDNDVHAFTCVRHVDRERPRVEVLIDGDKAAEQYRFELTRTR